MTSKKAKPLYFRLVSDEVRSNCIKAIAESNNGDEILEVIVQPENRKRSLAQNRIYWLSVG